ncbi:MAG: ribokinase [Acidimicrobiales bacterium]
MGTLSTTFPGNSTVVVVGSLNLDHVVRVERLPVPGETIAGGSYLSVPGGKGLNQAVTAARQRAPVAMVGCVGDDRAGELLRAVVSSEGISTSALRTLRGVPSGTALITVAKDGANTIVVAAGANALLGVEDVQAASNLLGPGAVVLAQLEVPLAVVEAALLAARQRGATTVLNPAPASAPLPLRLLSLVDVLVPNETEACALSGKPTALEAAAWLVAHGCRAVLVTVGKKGALLAQPGSPVLALGAYEVTAVDTTAAGDAFCGVLAVALARGRTITEAAQRASAAGALATTVAGALPSLPTSDDVDALLARSSPPEVTPLPAT